MSSSSASEARNRLEKVLAESIDCALGLKDLLVQEKNALHQRDTVALGKNSALKESCIGKLATLESARAAISGEAGFGAGPADMPALARWCDQGSVISRLWQRYLQIAQECDALNATNGAIIRVRQQQILAGIVLLRGGDASPETYGARGAGNAPYGGRELAEV